MVLSQKTASFTPSRDLAQSLNNGTLGAGYIRIKSRREWHYYKLSDVITNEIIKYANAKTAANELLKVTELIAYLTLYLLGGTELLHKLD
jgi:hypothetical protein